MCFVVGCFAGDLPWMRAQMTLDANKQRINFNIMELEVLVKEIKIYSVHIVLNKGIRRTLGEIKGKYQYSE